MANFFRVHMVCCSNMAMLQHNFVRLAAWRKREDKNLVHFHAASVALVPPLSLRVLYMSVSPSQFSIHSLHIFVTKEQELRAPLLRPAHSIPPTQQPLHRRPTQLPNPFHPHPLQPHQHSNPIFLPINPHTPLPPQRRQTLLRNRPRMSHPHTPRSLLLSLIFHLSKGMDTQCRQRGMMR